MARSVILCAQLLQLPRTVGCSERLFNAKPKEELYPDQLCIELTLESAILWWPALHVAGVGEQPTTFHRQIRPADDAIAPQERQRVVT